MIIKEVSLRNFRNYEYASVKFSPGMNIITGENAQGKTNLLESLVYLSLTRSHRIRNDAQLIKTGSEFSRVMCLVEDEQTNKKLGVVINHNGKNLSINNIPLKKSSEFIGNLNVVLFSPDDLGIFVDSPRERRKIINQEITKVSPKYLNSLNKYTSLLKNRNALLKNKKIDDNYLDILDEQMIEESEKIIKSRIKFIEMINHSLESYYKSISDDDIKAEINYLCCIDYSKDIHEELVQMYKNSREKDKNYQMTMCGIHREDIEFILDGRNVVLSASQGQKRMVMMSFKLSILDFIKNVTGKKPVLLLDDVLSELDQIRQSRLIEMVSNPYQCIITATEIPVLMKNKNYMEFKVEKGKIYPQLGGKR